MSELAEIKEGVRVPIEDVELLKADAMLFGCLCVRAEGDHYVRVTPEDAYQGIYMYQTLEFEEL